MHIIWNTIPVNQTTVLKSFIHISVYVLVMQHFSVSFQQRIIHQVISGEITFWAKMTFLATLIVTSAKLEAKLSLHVPELQ